MSEINWVSITVTRTMGDDLPLGTKGEAQWPPHLGILECKFDTGAVWALDKWEKFVTINEEISNA